MTIADIMTQELAALDDAHTPLSYEVAKRLVQHPDPVVRQRLARRTDAAREVLYFLAQDEDPEVRRNIALNPSTPVQANALLARDLDEGVRYNVACWVAKCAPAISTEHNDGLRRLFFEILKVLARDELALIRGALAEAIKGLASIPKEIIGALARDPEPKVSTPVLVCSPVLGESDLTEILKDNPPEPAVNAIARRDGIGPEVSDAVVAAGYPDAVCELLSNGSAQIREETLDALIEKAPLVADWQGPLANRVDLSPGFAARLAALIGGEFRDRLMARYGTDPAFASVVKNAGAAAADSPADISDGNPQNEEDSGQEQPTESPVERARAMFADGILDEDAISRAVTAGERAFVNAAIALKAGIPIASAAKILGSGSSKAVTALAWKAEVSMRLAILLQRRMAGVPPSQVLNARNGVDYPMSPEDMGWHLELFDAA